MNLLKRNKERKGRLQRVVNVTEPKRFRKQAFDFNIAVKWFKDNGYTVEVTNVGLVAGNHDPYYQAVVTGKGIRGYFCTDNGGTNPYTDQKFAADNAQCFDKISSCPLVVSLPCDLDTLKPSLEFLASKEGYAHSASFEYISCQILARDV